MREGFLKKTAGLSVSLLLVFLIFSVLVSASEVKLSTGASNESKVFVGDSLFFNDVTLTIRKEKVIPVDHLVFMIYNQKNDKKVASVNFSLIGDEIFGSDSAGVFTVVNVTDTSNLPYQNSYGYGYGYGYGSMDLTIIYAINYTTHVPGKFYAKLFVYSTTQTYSSGKSKPFTVLPAPSSSEIISIDILPGQWPNILSIRCNGLFLVAICGNKSFNVKTIDPKSIRLTLDGGKKQIKPLFFCYRDVATPGDQNGGRDGYTDLKLKFINTQVIYTFNLFKHPGDTYYFTITATLKKTFLPVEGHDSLQILTGLKNKKK